MLRQLERLTHPITVTGPAAQALAVYAEPATADQQIPTHLRPAGGSDLEGVACVDDAARAVGLYCDLWNRRKDMAARTAATRALRFLAHMQEADGRFVNFVFDWSGLKNRAGTTSAPGGGAWQVRALYALAWGVATFGDAEWGERFDLAVRWVDADLPHTDVLAVAVLAALKHWQATGAQTSADRARDWATAVASVRDGDILLNGAGGQPVHLWGHLQEAALADAGRLLGIPALLTAARASADALLVPAAYRFAAARELLPFDVSSTLAGLTAVHRAAPDPRYQAAIVRARSWFSGMNTAGLPVYNRNLGLVYDGIDEGRLSRNSGAESNIEGALALL